MLREFLYVDVTRARSLLAQLDEGVVEGVVASGGRKISWDAGAGLGAIKGARTTESSDLTQESKSLQDLVFVIFEDIATSLGLIRDVDPSDIKDSDDWETSRVHARFDEGELIRVFTPVLIVDPLFLGARFRKFMDMAEKLNALNAHNVERAIDSLREAFDLDTQQTLAEQVKGVQRDQRRQAERAFRKQRAHEFDQLKREAMNKYGRVEEGGLKELFEFMDSFLSLDSIYVRFLACGPELPDHAFVGSLLSRDEYIQRERETLYSRYGARLEGWTSVLQVARVPSEADRDAARDVDFADMALTDADNINRGKVLHASAQLEEMMEAIGIVEGPIWPGISVVPLAIYRTVPRSVDAIPGLPQQV